MDLVKKIGLKGKTIKLDEKTLITVLDEKINKLFRRIDVEMYIEHIFSGTPSRSFVKTIVAKLYGVSEENVIVKNVSSEYGLGVSKVHVHIYSDLDYMKKVELKHILKRNNIQV